MKYLSKMITFQEVPNEVALSFLITGCSLKCKGCHSPSAWNKEIGTELTPAILEKEIDATQGNITAVLFMGGEWEMDNLDVLLKIVKDAGLKTCLYTGLEESSVGAPRLDYIDYIKYGPYVPSLGGLDKKTTNQYMIDLSTGENITHYFQKNENNR